MNAAWGGIVEMDEILISLASHQTTDNLLRTKAFTVSMAGCVYSFFLRF